MTILLKRLYLFQAKAIRLLLNCGIMKNTLDFYKNEITLPIIGDKVLRDGYVFVVNDIQEIDDIFVIASISMSGEAGSVGVGYYDYLLHSKVN